jgi:hypothetical protein
MSSVCGSASQVVSMELLHFGSHGNDDLNKLCYTPQGLNILALGKHPRGDTYDAVELMQGDVAIQMPTDLRTVALFEAEPEFRPRQRKGITALTVDIPSSNHRARSNDTRPASRWKTPEFALYYAVFLTAVPIMVWVPANLSSSA